MKQKKNKKKERNWSKKQINYRLIKDRAIRDIKALFEQKQKDEDYFKLKRGSNFHNNNYMEHESNGDRNKNLSLDEYLNKIETYLKNTIIDLQKSDTWIIQLTIPINLFL